MKQILITLAMLAATVANCCAQGMNNAKMERGDKYVSVDFDLLLGGLDVNSNRAVLLTPLIVSPTDTLEMPSVGVYGRNRYYHYVRNGHSALSGDDETILRNSEKPDTLHYHHVVAYDPRMEGSQLAVLKRVYGCCNGLRPETELMVMEGLFQSPQEPWMPALAYVCPPAEGSKERSLSGRAFIDFPVNRTEIHPEYRNNMRELMKITATIDSIRNDKDISAKALAVKGFASPESPYSNNERLAKGRTEALRVYVQDLYNFPQGFIQTSYEPEDWAGLRAYVAASELPHKQEILARIDAPGDPDKKEAGIKSAYPQEYAQLYKEIYPALRHTDYTIEYTIRTYTDVNEIREIIKKNPQKLSLNELFLLAQSYEMGSDEFIEVFETTVRLFPSDKVANLNAANTALSRQDLAAAERYLQKAGESLEATYARGVLLILSEKPAEARPLIEKAANAGLPEAKETLQKMNEKGL